MNCPYCAPSTYFIIGDTQGLNFTIVLLVMNFKSNIRTFFPLLLSNELHVMKSLANQISLRKSFVQLVEKSLLLLAFSRVVKIVL
jgi:hypothetical protein